MFQILVVEDDADLQNLFCKTLIRNNYQAYGAKNVQHALNILEKEYIDLIISDVMMPGTNGFDFVRQLRESRIEIPVLIITAKGDIMDKQYGFNAGADDYMVKPIDINEMLLRVSALLRRAKSVSEKKLAFGNTLIEYDSCTVTDKNGSQVLPLKEFQLLYKLLSYPRRTFSRAQLMDEFWDGETSASLRAVDVYITRIRDKMSVSDDFKIMTVHGLGYKAVPNA